MNYINGAIELFKNCQTCGSATALAIAAFVLGAICSCLVCKLFGGCSKKKCAKGGSCAKKSALKGNEERPFEKRKPHPAPADGSVEIYVGNLSLSLIHI